jgi:hypothetical protein
MHCWSSALSAYVSNLCLNYNMNFLLFQTDAPNGVRTLKNEKHKFTYFFYRLSGLKIPQIISDIKNYEGVIDFKLTHLIMFGTKM